MFPLQTLINILFITHLTPISAFYQVSLRSKRSAWLETFPFYASGTVSGYCGSQPSFKVGECRKFTNIARDGDLVALGVYNKDNLPMATTFAFYHNGFCGTSKIRPTDPPNYVAVLDPKDPGGVWVVDLEKALGAPAAIGSYVAINYDVQIKPGGVLGGPKKSKTIYDNTGGKMVAKKGGIKKVYGKKNKFDKLIMQGEIFAALRDVTERTVIPGSERFPPVVENWLFKGGKEAGDVPRKKIGDRNPTFPQADVPETMIPEDKCEDVQVDVTPEEPVTEISEKPAPKPRGRPKKRIIANPKVDDTPKEIDEIYTTYMDPVRFQQDVQTNFDAFLTDPNAPFPDPIEEEIIPNGIEEGITDIILDNKLQEEILVDLDEGYETPDEQRLVKGRPLEEIDREDEVVDLKTVDGRAARYKVLTKKAGPWVETQEAHWIESPDKGFITDVEDAESIWPSRSRVLARLLALGRLLTRARDTASREIPSEEFDEATANRSRAYERLTQSMNPNREVVVIPEALSPEVPDLPENESTLESSGESGILIETAKDSSKPGIMADSPVIMEIESSEDARIEITEPPQTLQERIANMIRSGQQVSQEFFQSVKRPRQDFQPPNEIESASVVEPTNTIEQTNVMDETNVIEEELRNLELADVFDPSEDIATPAIRHNREVPWTDLRQFDPDLSYGQAMSSSSRRRQQARRGPEILPLNANQGINNLDDYLAAENQGRVPGGYENYEEFNAGTRGIRRSE
ncbi:hypothetical protein TWF694_004002 [Orbilia ellipsospora]|uniref:Uncharacterized protein n=1 Tax=Orbilia ellipsospora TaxID=2528407 RepID=A0AAV9WWT4_9PEZI